MRWDFLVLLVSSGCMRVHLLIVIQMPFDLIGGYYVAEQ
jgi:hypothetical protein